MSRIQKILLGLLIALIAIQFIQPTRNKSGQISPMDISKIHALPENVQSVLKRSCYDCHSSNTIYPWYSNIQPFGWWLASHVKKGKEELNFSEFGSYSSRKQRSKLFAISKSVEDGTMPLASYTLIHTKSRLSKGNKAIIIHWAGSVKDSLSVNN